MKLDIFILPNFQIVITMHIMLQRYSDYKVEVCGEYLQFTFKFYLALQTREGEQRRHDPLKNDLRASGFAELPPGPAKLVSQPQ